LQVALAWQKGPPPLLQSMQGRGAELDEFKPSLRNPKAPTATHNPAGASPNAPSRRHADHPTTDRPVRRNSTSCKTALNALSYVKRMKAAVKAITDGKGDLVMRFR
jgi:hypothetical protein